MPVNPKKGHLLITDRYPGFANHQLIELGYVKKAHENSQSSVAFNIQPRKTGQMLIGSSREFSGFDKSINKDILKEMLRKASEYMPGVKNLKGIRAWTGLRPSPPEIMPLIGEWPDIKGLLICAGHEGLGITTSLASAKIIRSLILKEKTEMDISVFSPSNQLKEAVGDAH